MRGASGRESRLPADIEISIHAPLAGCDREKSFICGDYKDFNPRTPCGVRPRPRFCHAFGNQFQSTHPLRGATAAERTAAAGREISIHAPLAGCDGLCDVVGKILAISIHAPLAGCDSHHSVYQRMNRAFQSTHPLRGATTRLWGWRWAPRKFQSTHPLRGATVLGRAGDRLFDISIHAPLAGCDLGHGGEAVAVVHFNPRTPCGVRRQDARELFPCLDFNPRTPCGVRRHFTRTSAASTEFQSTHPLRGATL